MDEFLQEKAKQAADAIRERGWCRGNLGYNPGHTFRSGQVIIPPDACKVCALGAGGVAWFGDPQCGYGYNPQGVVYKVLDPRYDEFLDALASVIAPGWESMGCDCDGCGCGEAKYESASNVIEEWNDASGRTAEEVISAYERLAYGF